MFANNYRDHIAVLKEREVRPSFDRVTAMLDARDVRRDAVLALAPRIGGVLVAVSAIVLLALLLPFGSNPDTVQHSVSSGSSAPRTTGTQATQMASGFSSSVTKSKKERATHVIVGSEPFMAIVAPELPVPPPIGGTIATEKEITVIPTQALSVAAPSLIAVPQPIGIPPLSSSDYPANRFFLLLRGAVAQEMNSQPEFRSLSASDAFFGGGYIFSSRFSIGLVAGSESFIVGRTSYSTQFHDATFTHDGVAYHSVIGEIVTGQAPFSTQIYSIAATVRYVIAPNPSSPFAELFGGGSTEGAVAGASLGMSLFKLGSASLDADAFLRELIPPSGSMLTKVGAEAQVRYEW